MKCIFEPIGTYNTVVNRKIGFTLWDFSARIQECISSVTWGTLVCAVRTCIMDNVNESCKTKNISIPLDGQAVPKVLGSWELTLNSFSSV
jgi:hypothetical protein